jgi:magnesium-transporting ATPase (P-type)
MLQEVSPVDEGRAAAYWHRSAARILRELAGSPAGLSSEEAAARLERVGRNTLEGRRRDGSLRLLARQFENPIILILVFASLLAFFLGDAVDAWIILAIVLLSGLLGFWREHGPAGAVEALPRARVEGLARRRSRADGRGVSGREGIRRRRRTGAPRPAHEPSLAQLDRRRVS